MSAIAIVAGLLSVLAVVVFGARLMAWHVERSVTDAEWQAAGEGVPGKAMAAICVFAVVSVAYAAAIALALR